MAFSFLTWCLWSCPEPEQSWAFPKINRKLNSSKIEGRKGHTGPLGQPWGEELPCRFLSRPGGSQQVLMCVWCWGPFVNTNWYLGIFASWFWHLTTVNKHLFGTLYWSPSERVYDRSVLWCVSVYSICMKWKLTFSSPVATADFSKFPGILRTPRTKWKGIYIYNGILLSQKKEYIGLSSKKVDEIRGYYTEWSTSEREKQISYIDTCIWSLERWYWWMYLQGSNGDTDPENRLADTEKEGEGGTKWESGIDTYTLPH